MVGNSSGAAGEIRLLPAFEVLRGGRSLSLPARAQRLIALLAISLDSREAAGSARRAGVSRDSTGFCW